MLLADLGVMSMKTGMVGVHRVQLKGDQGPFNPRLSPPVMVSPTPGANDRGRLESMGATMTLTKARPRMAGGILPLRRLKPARSPGPARGFMKLSEGTERNIKSEGRSGDVCESKKLNDKISEKGRHFCIISAVFWVVVSFELGMERDLVGRGDCP